MINIYPFLLKEGWGKKRVVEKIESNAALTDWYMSVKLVQRDDWESGKLAGSNAENDRFETVAANGR